MLNHALFKCPMPVALMGCIFMDQLSSVSVSLMVEEALEALEEGETRWALKLT
jgi:hypothetical protein